MFKKRAGNTESAIHSRGTVMLSERPYIFGITPDSAMQYSNTRGAYKALAEHAVDLAVLVKPSAEQLAYAEEQGAELEFVPLGYDAFVFFVNESNPVESLTCEQIRDIYAGEIHRWDQVGGKRVRQFFRDHGGIPAHGIKDDCSLHGMVTPLYTNPDRHIVPHLYEIRKSVARHEIIMVSSEQV